ncbi:MAG: undecaprenyl-diphosphatase UppP [Syntrophomonadales bacterium]
MSIIEALLLGLVQGLTEFLPVSSSGHLVIFQHLLGIQEPPLTFDTLVHLGTLIPVFVVFWPDIAEILKKPFSRLPILVVVGCIPAAAMGILLEPVFEKAFESLLVVGIGLLITGFILVLAEKLSTRDLRNKNWSTMTAWDAILIGVMQGIAITPGISRSGSTIAGSLLRGLNREYAARFSFLLSIPVIMGAGLLQLKDLPAGAFAGLNWIPYLVGPAVAAVSGYVAIKLVLRFVKSGRLSVFSYYCWAVGLITLVSYVFF